MCLESSGIWGIVLSGFNGNYLNQTCQLSPWILVWCIRFIKGWKRWTVLQAVPDAPCSTNITAHNTWFLYKTGVCDYVCTNARAQSFPGLKKGHLYTRNTKYQMSKCCLATRCIQCAFLGLACLTNCTLMIQLKCIIGFKTTIDVLICLRKR